MGRSFVITLHITVTSFPLSGFLLSLVLVWTTGLTNLVLLSRSNRAYVQSTQSARAYAEEEDDPMMGGQWRETPR